MKPLKGYQIFLLAALIVGASLLVTAAYKSNHQDFKEYAVFAVSGGGFIEPTSKATLEVESASAADTTQTLTVYGSSETTATSEAFVLNGVTAVTGATIFEAIYGVRLDGVAAGAVTVTLKLATEETIATVTAGAKYCYNAGQLDDSSGNLPAGMVVTTTGWLSDTSDTWLYARDGLPAMNAKCSDVTNPITWIYQISDDNVNWINGATSLTNMDNNQTRKAATETMVRYLRLVLTHTIVTPEANASVNILVINK